MCLELKKLQLLWQKLALQMKMLSFKTPYYTQFSIFPSEPNYRAIASQICCLVSLTEKRRHSNIKNEN